MKLRSRIKKCLVMALTASMVSSMVSMPVMAAKTEESTNTVTFTVEPGDLLIATNPAAWIQTDDLVGWDKQSESLGTVNLATAANAGTKTLTDRFDKKESSAGEHIHCATIEKNEKYMAWKKKHPGSSIKEAEVKDTQYKVGDLMWHGCDREYLPGADVLMGKAPVYYGNNDSEGKTAVDFTLDQPTEQRQGYGTEQVYRQYKCMFTAEDFTIWSYVAGSEKTEAPEEDDIYSKDEGDTYPTYLSSARAEEFGTEMTDKEFMKKVTEAAGNYKKNESKGDEDGKVAIIVEPMSPSTLGFVWQADRDPVSSYFNPVTKLDCLHIQAQCTLGDHVEKEKPDDPDEFKYDEDTGVPPYATMAHELTHYVVSGFCEEASGWINEWFAQAVMMDVVPWDATGEADKTISDDVVAIGGDIRGYGKMRVFAGPTDPNDSLTYPISTLMAGYFTGRLGQDLWRHAIESGSVTEDSFSRFLVEKEGGPGKDLNWWRSSFSITVLGQVKGEETSGGEEEEFILNPFGKDEQKKGTVGGTHTAVADFVRQDLQNSVASQEEDGVYKEENLILHPLSDISELEEIEGGGTAYVFEVGKDDVAGKGTLTITGVGEDVVWAHKDSKGNIEVSRFVPEPEPETASRDADGTWHYTANQEAAFTQSERCYELDMDGMKVNLNLYAKDAAFYVNNKKALTQSIIDTSRSYVAIDNVKLPVKKVALKNCKKSYVSPNSIFKETISENNLAAYAEYKDSKLPGYVVTIDTKGITETTMKKAAKQANKMFKRNPIGIDLLPINLTSKNVTVEKYNDNKQVVKKMSVKDEDSNVFKCKKKDFSSEAQGDVNIITGEINFNGSVIYDPQNNTVKAY